MSSSSFRVWSFWESHEGNHQVFPQPGHSQNCPNVGFPLLWLPVFLVASKETKGTTAMFWGHIQIDTPMFSCWNNETFDSWRADPRAGGIARRANCRSGLGEEATDSWRDCCMWASSHSLLKDKTSK